MTRFWRAVLVWILGYVLLFISALAVMFALTGCASPPPYLCVPARLENGQPASYCHPLPTKGD